MRDKNERLRNPSPAEGLNIGRVSSCSSLNVAKITISRSSRLFFASGAGLDRTRNPVEDEYDPRGLDQKAEIFQSWAAPRAVIEAFLDRQFFLHPVRDFRLRLGGQIEHQFLQDQALAAADWNAGPDRSSPPGEWLASVRVSICSGAPA